ncbi:hypothetical protein BD413DRAFT_473883 [Trametes elegans]|nr:hypothetical protein BD413DRAFT_473883 [Trametes elegans]
MATAKDAPTLYTASVNPPRRAKRPQSGSLVARDTLPTPSAPSNKAQQGRAPRPPILPKQSSSDNRFHLPPSPESDSASEEEDEYDPGRDAAPPPKRRGRKPGAMSRSARESLRKLNHSKIEKARRTKINETLAMLSTLVNDRGRVLPDADASGVPEAVPENDDKGKKGKGKTEEKEFKLDVLVKTVEFMQDLIGRVKTLEDAMCAQCRTAELPFPQSSGEPVSPTPLKRKRAQNEEEPEHAPLPKRAHQRQDDDDCYIGDDEHGLGNGAEDEQPSPLPFIPKPPSTSPKAAPTTSSPRLPPIASWLPHPYVDPSSLMSASPSAGPVRSPQNAQLPSPPSSGRFRPTATLANMPALTLPGPAHPLTLVPGAGPVPPRQARKSVSASPSVSPTWTPEDETAASLLLQMSSKPRSASLSNSRSPPALPGPLGIVSPREEAGKTRVLEVVTPGTLLGMRD